ncbi:MAG: RNA methyltransferase [Ignavibacteria bacterium]|nr:RNA methyltransferase [Ignavibacteria bacterium]
MTKNEIKYYSGLKIKKYRDSEKKFLIEGVHLIQECLKSKNYRTNLEKVIIREDFRNEELLKIIRNNENKTDIILLNEKTFSHLAETVNSQGIIGVVAQNSNSFLKEFPDGNLIVALDSINDPGNLGTIIRTSYWFGADQMLISKNSVDLFNSKVIRSSQGALFNLNIIDEADLEVDLKKLYEKKYNIILTALNSDTNLSDFRFKAYEKYVFVFGNEASGISRGILDNKNYQKIRISGFTDCESLNISVSAGIFLNTFRNKQLVP